MQYHIVTLLCTAWSNYLSSASAFLQTGDQSSSPMLLEMHTEYNKCDLQLIYSLVHFFVKERINIIWASPIIKNVVTIQKVWYWTIDFWVQLNCTDTIGQRHDITLGFAIWVEKSFDSKHFGVCIWLCKWVWEPLNICINIKVQLTFTTYSIHFKNESWYKK